MHTAFRKLRYFYVLRLFLCNLFCACRINCLFSDLIFVNRVVLSIFVYIYAFVCYFGMLGLSLVKLRVTRSTAGGFVEETETSSSLGPPSQDD